MIFVADNLREAYNTQNADSYSCSIDVYIVIEYTHSLDPAIAKAQARDRAISRNFYARPVLGF